MSSTRLDIPAKLLEELNKLHQTALAYEKEHATDGLYEQMLLKPLREKHNNTRIDFIEDYVINLALLENAGEDAQENIDSFNYQVINAGSIPIPITKLIYDIELLKAAFSNDPNKQEIFDYAINELNNLSLHAEKILLIGYKNHLGTLIEMLNKLEEAPQQYKQEHQADHLYEEALEKPCKLVVEAGLDFVQDFLKNCQSIRSHVSGFEEKSSDTSKQLISVKELDRTVSHLLEEISLFKKAPKIDETKQKVCADAILDLKHLKLLTERLFIKKSI